MSVNNLPVATNGQIFYENVRSSLDQVWRNVQSASDPRQIDELLNLELINAQFFGDYSSFDRLLFLSDKWDQTARDNKAILRYLARVLATSHRFDEAELRLDEVRRAGLYDKDAHAIQCSIDQARGQNIETLLGERHRLCEQDPRIPHFIAYGSLLAELEEFEQANVAFMQSFTINARLSPLGFAWASFELGKLWGETIPNPDSEKARFWYEAALNYLPNYVHAAVHLSEIQVDQKDYAAAGRTLDSVLASNEPEVYWRRAELLERTGRTQDAQAELKKSYTRYQQLLAKHELAFADHAVEFLLATGLNPQQALALAITNRVNRPTKRAFELVYLATGPATVDEIMSAL